MCLDKITKIYKPSLFNLWIPKLAYKSGYGWKWFYGNDEDGLRAWYFSISKKMPLNIFIDERDYREPFFKSKDIIYGADIKYKLGWHIFTQKPPNYYGCITRKVKYREGHTLGVQEDWKEDRPTIVAKYMKILED